MIFIVTNKGDYTADFLILELHQRGIEFVRFNTEDFPTKCSISISIEPNSIAGTIVCDGHRVEISTIRSIWYRRPVSCTPHSSIVDEAAREFVASESQETLTGLWKVIDCFWVSHPENLARAESKILQLREASQLGFNIPETLITNDPFRLSGFYEKNLPELIYKPLRHSRFIRGDSVSLLYTNLVTQEYRTQFEKVKFSPSLFQPYIPKSVEVRVTVIGKLVFASELHSQDVEDARIDWRRVDSRRIRHMPHTLPKEVEQKCILLLARMGLAFGAIDLILTPSGNYIFLEINPNGQWAWIQQLCPELDIRGALIDLLLSATANGQNRTQ